MLAQKGTLRPLAQRCCALGLALPLLASAGLFDDEEARRAVLDLRQRQEAQRQATEALDRKASEDNAQLQRSLLELQNQIEQLRSEVASARGSNEQLARDLAESQRRQKDLSQSVDERLRKFEPVKVSVDGRDFLAEPNEKRDYESAWGQFRKGEFTLAQAELSDFVRRWPQSGYAASALFWLGNAQYATRDYKEALVSFRAMLTQAPAHLKAAEALLSVANCQIELKDSKAGRKTLEELVKTYPDSEAAQAARDRLAKSKP
jgi:tol-pal system protein YbgF